MHGSVASRRTAAALLLFGVLGAGCTTRDTTSLLAPPASASAYTSGGHLPSAPQAVNATAGNASAVVSWQPPAWSGLSHLTGYTVVASPGGTSTAVQPWVTTATVTGLTNGTTYTFVVYASNRFGTSAASSPSNPVTPAGAVINPPPTTSSSGRCVSGYYIGYQRGLYPETSIDFSNMTHVIVGAIEATSTGGVTTDFFLGSTAGPAMAKTVSSRAHAAGRKAILMLGGSGFRDNLLASATNYRATFVSNLLAAMDSSATTGSTSTGSRCSPAISRSCCSSSRICARRGRTSSSPSR